MEDYLKNLNKAQLEAVTSTEGYIRVIAGAGSGKTKALTSRFAYLVNDMGILPGNILCVTFTNKAANEMSRRIHNLTGDNDTGYISTFHGFCVSVLQEDSYAVQYPRSFLVLDNSDINAMLKTIYEERNLSLRDMTFSDARDMIEIQKLFKHPDYYLDMIIMSLDSLHEKYLSAADTRDIIFYGYLYQEKKCFALDYNDLIKFTLYIFSENAGIREKWQRRLEYIMIDEFQDIDMLQYSLMEILCAYHKNLFVVGDPDQTIYTWRGADIKYLLDFDTNFPGTKTIMMMENYRSTPEIIAVANSLIRKNKNRMEKNLLPTLPSGQTVVCHCADDAESEAEWISNEIKQLNGRGTEYRDITLLYRSHFVTRTVEEVFRRKNLPYVIYSGTHFYEREEVKDALSYLRMVAYRDDLSFARIANKPKRNLGIRRMHFLEEYAAEHGCSLYQALKDNIETDLFKGTRGARFIDLIENMSESSSDKPVSELLADILDKSGYEEMRRTEGDQERLDNLAELKQSVHEFEVSCGEEATLENYISHVALFTNADTADTGNKVRLMTVHASKGLEFPYVFLVEMNEGVFPSGKVKTLAGMEEERRLAFVAVTRAEKGLYLSEANGFNHDSSPRYPSRFLLNIDRKLLAFTHEPDENRIKEAECSIQNSERYLPDHLPERLAPGTRVQHDIMGCGTVLDFDSDKMAYQIQFDGLTTIRNISVKAKLKEITQNQQATEKQYKIKTSKS